MIAPELGRLSIITSQAASRIVIAANASDQSFGRYIRMIWYWRRPNRQASPSPDRRCVGTSNARRVRTRRPRLAARSLIGQSSVSVRPMVLSSSRACSALAESASVPPQAPLAQGNRGKTAIDRSIAAIRCTPKDCRSTRGQRYPVTISAEPSTKGVTTAESHQGGGAMSASSNTMASSWASTRRSAAI